MSTVYDFSAKDIDGHEQKLDAYKGKAMLVVNVASKQSLRRESEEEFASQFFDNLHIAG